MPFLTVVVEDLNVVLAAEVVPNHHEDAGAAGATDHVALEPRVHISAGDYAEDLGKGGRRGERAGCRPRGARDGPVHEALSHGESRPRAGVTGVIPDRDQRADAEASAHRPVADPVYGQVDEP